MMHQLYWLCMVKEIVSLLSLKLMYSYLNELTLYAGVLYMEPSWYSFSSYIPHIDIKPLGHSVTWPCLFFYSRDVFGIGYQIFFIHVGFSATQNTCDRYNKFVIDHLKIILCTIQWILSNPNSSNSNTR